MIQMASLAAQAIANGPRSDAPPSFDGHGAPRAHRRHCHRCQGGDPGGRDGR
ncbi:hypothetical protein [uncultured Sphingomonas sp.]|uniref:hypothetical protein n=1 Tax=uncultured Sphingomonas sp. TaxID=158754 RepID=UPI0025FCB3CF|nr:hypothetical protein [uncultured Sphingomonas sp.]